MRKLILVRHSLPEIAPNVPPDQWVLSERGRRLCKTLVARLAIHNPHHIVSSRQPKALETARIIADTHGTPLEQRDDLHEVDWRANVGFLTKEKYETTIASFFQNPDEVAFGRETANEAHQRFSRALSHVFDEHSQGNLVVVAHGIVIALFVSRAARMDPYPLWKRLGTPFFVALSLPKLKVIAVVEDVEKDPA